MSRRDDTVPMRHMLDYARETVAMVRGRSRGDVDTDRMLQLALTRLLEMIGEAANRVTVPGRARYRDIPWQNIINTRELATRMYEMRAGDLISADQPGAALGDYFGGRSA